MARYNILLSGYPEIVDEPQTFTNSTARAIGHDLFMATGLEIWTGLLKTGTKLTLNTDYTLNNKNDWYSDPLRANTTIDTKVAVINGAYQNSELYFTYTTIGDLGSKENILEIVQGDVTTDIKIIRLSKKPTELIFMEVEQVPVTLATALAGTAEYNPIIDRHSNHDVSTTQTSQETVDAFLSQKWTAAGVSQFTATLSGGVLTFASTTANNAMLAALYAQHMVARWHGSSEATNYADSGALYTGAMSWALKIVETGVYYGVSNVSTVSRTIDLATYPANGTVTVEIHPYAIAGSTTSFRLRKLSGFVLVPGYDATNENLIGGDQMDRIQGHFHAMIARINSGDTGVFPFLGGVTGQNGPTDVTITGSVIDMVTSGLGTPRTGKTTEAKRHAVAMYTFLRDLYATSWTSA